MNLYRQTITLFGIVVPLLIAAALIAAGYFCKSAIASSFENKMSTYRTYEAGRLAALEVETKVTRQRSHLQRWETLLSQETASTFTTNLREIIDHLPSKEIQQTAFDPSATGGLGVASTQKSAQVRLAMRGTFRTVQRAFLELETRMPQLQLEEMKIDTNATQSALLNFQVSYTSWEN